MEDCPGCHGRKVRIDTFKAHAPCTDFNNHAKTGLDQYIG